MTIYNPWDWILLSKLRPSICIKNLLEALYDERYAPSNVWFWTVVIQREKVVAWKWESSSQASFSLSLSVSKMEKERLPIKIGFECRVGSAASMYTNFTQALQNTAAETNKALYCCTFREGREGEKGINVTWEQRMLVLWILHNYKTTLIRK